MRPGPIIIILGSLGAFCGLPAVAQDEPEPAPAPLKWDEVHLRDGRVIKGSARSTGTGIVVRRPHGRILIPYSRIARVVDRHDPFDERARLLVLGLDEGTVAQRLRYARFCQVNELERDARQAFLGILRLDPDHAEARAALGYVRHDGRWMTPTERQEARGLVLHEGRWIPRAERERILAAEAAQRERERAARVAEEERIRAARAAKDEREHADRLLKERIAALEDELAQQESHRAELEQRSRPRRIRLGFSRYRACGCLRAARCVHLRSALRPCGCLQSVRCVHVRIRPCGCLRSRRCIHQRPAVRPCGCLLSRRCVHQRPAVRPCGCLLSRRCVHQHRPRRSVHRPATRPCGCLMSTSCSHSTRRRPTRVRYPRRIGTRFRTRTKNDRIWRGRRR